MKYSTHRNAFEIDITEAQMKADPSFSIEPCLDGQASWRRMLRTECTDIERRGRARARYWAVVVASVSARVRR
jgi:hypothetical protein